MNYTLEYWPALIIVIIGLTSNLLLFRFVLKKLPYNNTVLGFLFFVASSIFWQLQDIMLRISADYYTANIWYHFFIFGILFSGTTGLHFALEFTNKLNKNNRLPVLALLYLPGLIIEMIYLTDIYTFDLEHIPFWNWGYKGDLNNTFLLICIAYIFVTASSTMVILYLNILKSKGEIDKKRALWVFMSYSLPGLFGFIGEIYSPLFTPYGDQRVTTIALTFMPLFIAIGLRKYRLFDYSPKYAIDEIINTIKESIVITDNEYKIRYVNYAFKHLTSYKDEEILGDYFSILIKENTLEIDNFNDDITQPIELVIYTKNDNQVWVNLTKKSITDNDGNVIGYLFTLNNISELKFAEEMLELSDKKYKDVVNTIEEGIIQTNINNEIIFYNNKTTEILELDKSEINFKNINSIFNKEIITPYIDNHITTEVTYISPNGNIKWLLLNIKLLEAFHNGHIISISDITMLKEKEFEILNSIYETQELERKRIAEELHDGLAQTLAAANMYLNSLSEEIAACGQSNDLVINRLSETQSILKQSLQETREISHDLMPIAISEYGLKKSLHDLINKINKVNKVQIKLYTNIDKERFPEEIELALYRISQEIINNTLKHSQAKNLCLNLYFKAGYVFLISQDDGVGFDITNAKSNGLGIKNFENRIISFNGKVKIKSRKNKGTRIYVAIPLRFWK